MKIITLLTAALLLAGCSETLNRTMTQEAITATTGALHLDLPNGSDEYSLLIINGTPTAATLFDCGPAEGAVRCTADSLPPGRTTITVEHDGRGFDAHSIYLAP